jgi:monoamine oxidase
VKEVDYTGSNITVTAVDGTKYFGTRIIVTVPLGVLQSGSIQFTPALSQAKTDAINRLGMGLMDKLWLEFPSAFWTNDLQSDWISYISDTPGQWIETLNVYKYTNKPVLLMFNVGQSARNFQS